MAKKYWDEEINKHQDWGGDASTENLPVLGSRVQQFIKTQLEGKGGNFYYDATNNRYLVFADEENRDKYLQTLDTSLIIGTFDAPFNFSAQINLISKPNNIILEGTTEQYLEFTFDTTNKSGQSVGESVNATFTFIRSGNRIVVKKQYPYGTHVRFNIDEYLGVGQNIVTIGIVGQQTLAATSVGVIYEVVSLGVSDGYDISTPERGDFYLEYTVSGAGIKTMEFFLDGELLPYESSDTIASNLPVTRTKRIPLAGLPTGLHNVQYRAYIERDGERFYSKTVYMDIMLIDNNYRDTLIALKTEFPSGIKLQGETLNITGIVQFALHEIKYAVFNPKKYTDNQVEFKLDGVVVSIVSTTNEMVYTYSLRSSTYGTRNLLISSDTTTYPVILTIEKSQLDLEEEKDGLMLSLSALGRTNNNVNRSEWKYGSYESTFTNFKWDDQSGWVDNRLLISGNAQLSINISPLATSLTLTGGTIEIEFSTESVDNRDTVLINLTNPTTNAGLLLTASSARLRSAGGKEVETKFKESENIKVTFVINRSTGSINRQTLFIYINGIQSGGEIYLANDNFLVSSNLVISSNPSGGATMKLKGIKVYNRPLLTDQVLNNYIVDRDTVAEMLAIYDKNNVLTEDGLNLSVEKLASQTPVFIFTGDIPTLLNSMDTSTTVYTDIEYINLQNPERAFTTKGTRTRLQGTSSLGYPRKNFRVYFNYGTLYDSFGNIVPSGKYQFKDNAQPVTTFTLKADYAESSMTHNTGIARLWNQALYGLQVNGEYVGRTQAQKAAIANSYPYDVRTAIDGFPMVAFYRLTETSPLIFMGQYNFDNDKSTESVFGFRDIPGFDNSRVQCFEVLNNTHHLALMVDALNFDTQWMQAYEFRYPGNGTNTSDLKQLVTWVASTNHNPGTTYSGNITIAAELRPESNGTYADSAANRQKKFEMEKWDYLDVYKVAAYYCYLLRFGAVDQVIKNSMLTTEGTKGQGTKCKWFYINYDNDTVNGLRNDGMLVYPPTILRNTIDTSFAELTYAYMGHDSPLWNNLEADAEFMNIVSIVDNGLYAAGLTYGNVINMFDFEQSDKWSERVYNQNQQYKYLDPYFEQGINNLFMLQGSRKSHRRYWLSQRFDYIDALHVAGAYKSKVIEFKVAGSDGQFSITAGTKLMYGYGINNDAIETKIPLEVGESKTFTLPRVLAIGDPVRIFSAQNVRGIDLSPLRANLAQINLSDVTDINSGTKFKNLILGASTGTNLSLMEISGLAAATALEVLDVRGYKGLTALDLTGKKFFRKLRAVNSGLTGVVFDKGIPLDEISFPTTMQVVEFDSFPLLAQSGITITWANVYSLTIKNCPLLNSYNMTVSWLNAKTTPNPSCSLVLTNINWGDINADWLISLGTIGNLDLTGKIRLTSINQTQYDALLNIFGIEVFNPDNRLFIDAPDSMFISGPKILKAAQTYQYTGTMFPVTEATVKFYFLQSGSQVTEISSAKINPDTGVVTTKDILTAVSGITIRGRSSAGGSIYADYTDISVSPRIYLLSAALSLEKQYVGQPGDYNVIATLNASTPGSPIEVDFTPTYTLTGTAFTNGHASLVSSSKNGCVIRVTHIEETETLYVRLNTVDELGRTMQTSNLNIPIVDMPEGVIITSKSNAPVMAACYAAGWCASSTQMTLLEAQAVSQIGTAFQNKTSITYFEEFEHFTSILNIPDNAFQGTRYMRRIKLPPQITSIGKYAFRGDSSNSPTWLEEIVLPESVTTLDEGAFAYSGIKSITFPNNGKEFIIENVVFSGCRGLTEVTLPDKLVIGRTSISSPTSGNSIFNGCTSLHTLNYAGSIENIKAGTVARLLPSVANCTSLVNLGWPTSDNNYVYLPGGCFNGCPLLLELVIPDYVFYMGDYMFKRSPIHTITLPNNPNNPTNMGLTSNVFYFASKLKTIISHKVNGQSLSSIPFGNSDSSYTGRDTYNQGVNRLYVPSNATGYDAGAWLTLLDPTKCGFTLSKTL